MLTDYVLLTVTTGGYGCISTFWAKRNQTTPGCGGGVSVSVTPAAVPRQKKNHTTGREAGGRVP